MTIETIAYIYVTTNQLQRVENSDIEINETLTSEDDSRELKISITTANVFLLKKLRIINAKKAKILIEDNVEVVHIYN